MRPSPSADRWGPGAQSESPLGKQLRHVYKHRRTLCLLAPHPTHSRPLTRKLGDKEKWWGFGLRPIHLCSNPCHASDLALPLRAVPVSNTDSVTTPCCCEATAHVRRLADALQWPRSQDQAPEKRALILAREAGSVCILEPCPGAALPSAVDREKRLGLCYEDAA